MARIGDTVRMVSQPSSSQPEWRQRANATRRRRSEQRILAAARELLPSRPLRDLTVEEIARAAGVPSSTVYTRFGTKAGVAAQLLAPDLLLLAEAAQADLESDLSAREAILGHLQRVGELVELHRDLAEVAFAGFFQGAFHVPPAEPQHPRQALMALPGILISLLREGQRRAELRPDFDADDVGRTLLNFFVIRFVSRDEPATVSAGFVADLILRGLLISS